MVASSTRNGAATDAGPIARRLIASQASANLTTCCIRPDARTMPDARPRRARRAARTSPLLQAATGRSAPLAEDTTPGIIRLSSVQYADVARSILKKSRAVTCENFDSGEWAIFFCVNEEIGRVYEE